MKFNRLFLVVFFFPFIQNGTSQTITVKNNSGQVIKDYMVEIPVKNLPLSVGSYSVVSKSGSRVPLEISADLNGNQKAIFPVENLKPNSTTVFSIEKVSADSYPKRTYAELAHKIGGKFNGNVYEGGFSWVKPNYMKVSGSFRDHAYYIKYEGPGWESDKIAYRFYLDERNAIDAFGKKTSGIVLPAVGVDGYANYHKMADWGMDHMRVETSLGIGSIGYWDGEKAIRVEKRDSVICFIPADGKVRSQVNTTYFGWNANGDKFNLKSLISIDAGSRASHIELKADRQIDNLTTGIIKNKDTELIKPSVTTGDWTYLATFGRQSMNDDIMGLAVFYKKKQLKTLTEDTINHLIVLNPDNGYAEYYFMVTWELDWNPVKDKTSFIKSVDEVLNRLNQPIAVKVTVPKK